MLSFTGYVDLIEFDAQGYTKTMRRAIEVRYRQSVRAFIRAAIKKVPVQTGMARGSFLNIARALRVNLRIMSRVYRYSQGRKKARIATETYYHPETGTIPKTPESGASLSTPVNEVLSWHGDTYRFKFDTRVFHYFLNEVTPSRSPSSPWFSFFFGREAFMKEIATLKLPKVGRFVIKTRAAWGGKGTKLTRSSKKKQRTVR